MGAGSLVACGGSVAAESGGFADDGGDATHADSGSSVTDGGGSATNEDAGVGSNSNSTTTTSMGTGNGNDGDDGDDDTTVTTDAGTSTASPVCDGDAGTSYDAGPEPDGSTITVTDAGTSVICTSTPRIPATGAANYCYSTSCSAPDSVCCDVKAASGQFTSSCVADASACVVATGATAHTYECDQPDDCALPAKCYLRATAGSDPLTRLSADACGTVAHVQSSICTSAPYFSDLRVCTTDADCTITGTTCVASVANDKYFGTCR